MGIIRVVCHVAGETEAQRWGGGQWGGPWVSRLRVERQSTQGRCKSWFCLSHRPAPAALHLVGGW